MAMNDDERQKQNNKYSISVWIALLVFATSVGAMCYQQTSGEWKDVAIAMIIFTMAIIILFGRQLPKIRGQEVEYVFLSFLAWKWVHEDRKSN
jgi:uncharacterized ion transporter superfamily protein YfcC